MKNAKDIMSENPGKVVTQYEFMTVFSKAWHQAMTIPNIISAFHTTGVYPFNRCAIDINDSTAPVDPGSESLADKTGLAFIPFYTPIRSHKSKSGTAAPFTDSASKDSDDDSTDFTEEEYVRYIKQLEGYDIASDFRYKLWLKKYGSGMPKRSGQLEACSDIPSNLLLGEAIASKSVIKQFLPKVPQMRSGHFYEDICKSIDKYRK